ncbi:MAG: HPP family protein [Verrucomicrobiota bacterium]
MHPTFRKSQIFLATMGAVFAVSGLAYVAMSLQGLLLLGSFGASALLLFALPDTPLAQPRSVVGGHVSASLIAIGCLILFGPHWWSVGLATGLAVGFMMVTHTVHPPAGSNAIIVFLAKPTLGYLMFSTLSGAVLLVVCAIIYHRTTRRHKYPLYWRRGRPALAKA